MAATYWKFLSSGSVGPFTGYSWPAGEWVSADTPDPCQAGFHACRRNDLPYWLADELWEVELAPPVRPARHKVVAGRARLAARVEAWTPDTARELADACVSRTVRHAVAELAGSGLDDAAHRLADADEAERDAVARECAERAAARGARSAIELCGYVSDVIEAAGFYPVASVAYIAARAAHKRSSADSADPYTAEREWQALWLAGRLSLG